MKRIVLCLLFIVLGAGYCFGAEAVTTATQPYFSTGQVQITPTAVVVVASNVNRTSVIVCNVSSNVVYLGNTSAVTSDTGKRLQSKECVTLDRNYGVIYGICASGVTSRVDYLEE